MQIRRDSIPLRTRDGHRSLVGGNTPFCYEAYTRDLNVKQEWVVYVYEFVGEGVMKNTAQNEKFLLRWKIGIAMNWS